MVKRDPAFAAIVRWSLIDQIKANNSALGIKLSATDLSLQRQFLSGELPMEQMLDQLRLYAETLLLCELSSGHD